MAATSTFLQATYDETDTSTYTYAAQNLGTASSDRKIIVAVHGRKSGANTTINSVTVGGISATIVVQDSNNLSNSNTAGIAIASVPSGTTGNVVVVFGATMARSEIGLWSVVGLYNSTPTVTATSLTNDGTCTINVLAGGFVIGAGTVITQFTTWSNLTERYDDSVSSTVSSGASNNFATAQTGLTITADRPTVANMVTVFAAWGDTPGSSNFFLFF